MFQEYSVNKIIVEFKNFWFKYVNTDEYALKSINLKIRKGEFILLTGPSGCGKSTLCRAINGLIPHFYEGEYKGEVFVLGKKASKVPTYLLAKNVGMVFQNPENQLFSSTVEREIAFGLENLGMSTIQIKKRVDHVLRLLGLENIRYKQPFELSGGQQQKVAIASILAMEPNIVILDEPTANLDPLSALNLLKLLKDLNKKLKITVIFVEHRLELATRFATRLILMKNGKIIEDGPPRNILLKTASKAAGIGIPKTIEIYKKLMLKGIQLDSPPITPYELAENIKKLKGKF